MTESVQPIPEGYHSITPYLTVRGAGRLMDFLKQAFGAEEIFRMNGREGEIRHAEARIGDSIVMMGEAREPWSPIPTQIYLYVTDTDAVYKKALGAGGTSVMEPAHMFYGDRQGAVKDPAGNVWFIATRVEEVPPDELRRRAEAAGM